MCVYRMSLVLVCSQIPREQHLSSFASRQSLVLAEVPILLEMFEDLLSNSTLKRATGILLATTFLFSSFKMLLSFQMSFTLAVRPKLCTHPLKRHLADIRQSLSQIMRSPKHRRHTTISGIFNSCTQKPPICLCGP